MSNDSTLCNIVARLIENKDGGECEINVIYKKGEMDVLHTNSEGIKSYYEIKSSYKSKLLEKGVQQVQRAIKYGVCNEGYVVTPNMYLKVKR